MTVFHGIGCLMVCSFDIGNWNPVLLWVGSSSVPLVNDLFRYLILDIAVKDVPDVVVMEAAHGNDAAPEVGGINDAEHVGDIAVEGVDKLQFLVHAGTHEVQSAGGKGGVESPDVFYLSRAGVVGLGVVPHHCRFLEGVLGGVLRERGILVDKTVEVGARRGECRAEDDVAVGVVELGVQRHAHVIELRCALGDETLLAIAYGHLLQCLLLFLLDELVQRDQGLDGGLVIGIVEGMSFRRVEDGNSQDADNKGMVLHNSSMFQGYSSL